MQPFIAQSRPARQIYVLPEHAFAPDVSQRINFHSNAAIPPAFSYVKCNNNGRKNVMKYIKYRETKEHGTFDFPMEFYHVGQAHPRYEMSFHWHIEYEIIRILKGELLIGS